MTSKLVRPLAVVVSALLSAGIIGAVAVTPSVATTGRAPSPGPAVGQPAVDQHLIAATPTGDPAGTAPPRADPTPGATTTLPRPPSPTTVAPATTQPPRSTTSVRSAPTTVAANPVVDAWAQTTGRPDVTGLAGLAGQITTTASSGDTAAASAKAQTLYTDATDDLTDAPPDGALDNAWVTLIETYATYGLDTASAGGRAPAADVAQISAALAAWTATLHTTGVGF